MAGIRTQKVISALFSGKSSVSLAKAIRTAGFSESYARNPQKLMKTKSWQEYLDELMPRNAVFDIHKKLLQSETMSTMRFPSTLSNAAIEEILVQSGYRPLTIKRGKKHVLATFVMPDNAIRSRAVDMAYRLRNEYRNGKGCDTADTSEIRALSDTELMAEIKALHGFFRHIHA